EQARARGGEAPVIWLHDDITAARLRGCFRVVLDRGCLHLLDEAGARRYAEALARLVAPGGCAVIKTLAVEAVGVTRWSAERIRACFGEAFTLERDDASTMPGAGGTPAARLFVLRRKAP